MSFIFRNTSGDAIEVPLRPDISDDLLERVREALARLGPDRLGQLSAYALLEALVTVCEPDDRPPTAAQIKFALDIATKLQLELPVGALRDRSIMGAFLTRFGDRARATSKTSALSQKGT